MRRLRLVNLEGTAPSPENATLLGIGCGAGAGALWGLVFLAPALLSKTTPLQLAAGRYVAYGVIAAVLAGHRWTILAARMTRRDWIALGWLSLAGNTLYYVLLSKAVQEAGIPLTSLVMGFLPLAVTIVGRRDKDAPPFRTLMPSLLFCILGTACIAMDASVQSPSSGHSYLAGLGCAVGALVSWTAYAVWNSRCLARLNHLSAHDWNLLTGAMTGIQAAMLLPIAFGISPRAADAASYVRLAGVSIGIAFIASIVGNALWNRMSQLLPLTMAGQMILFETVFALGYGLIWEHRLPHPLEVASLGFVTVSVLSCIAAHRRSAVSA